ncbi:MAG: NAD(P)H-binding protein [Paracoccaceae bacterium]|nr:NAD(P)H-binding protein [Paracoccaceae bacterium]
MTGARDVLLLGATGTAGRATARAVVARGHRLTCLIRPGAARPVLPAGTSVIEADPLDGTDLRAAVLRAAPEAVISCLASRTGAPKDAWAIDHAAQVVAFEAASAAGAGHFVLLSALCVQKPRLAFQHAKLAFEAVLQASDLTWSIVRPTAFFKSLSGQVERVRSGKPFLAFGDGQLTACKPISDADLGTFIADCLTDPARANRILPIGGPGPALTPLDQAAILSELLGREVPVRRVPVGLLDTVGAGLALAGRLSPRLAERAELARIARYYATESMLVWDVAKGRYCAENTPEFGRETLRDHYARLLSGDAEAGLGAHGVF